MTWALEAILRRVVAEQAALMRAHTGDGRQAASVVDDEADGRRGLEPGDVTGADRGLRGDRLPVAVARDQLAARGRGRTRPAVEQLAVDHGPRGKDDIANSVCGLIALLKYKRQSWGYLTWAYNITTAEKARWFYAGKGGMRADGYLGDGKFMTKSGEIYRDPRYS